MKYYLKNNIIFKLIYIRDINNKTFRKVSCK